MSSREIEDWGTRPPEDVSEGKSAAERFISFIESDQHRPEDPRRRQWAEDLVTEYISVMEDDPHRRTRDRIKDPLGALRSDLGESLPRYRQSGRIGRFIMRLREPETVKDIHRYDDIVSTLDSVRVAQQSAPANEGKIVIF